MTMPDAPAWPASDPAFRRSEISTVVGRGDEVWERACDDVLHWRVKTRSGFRVDASGPPTTGRRLTITARALGMTIREPIEVVATVRQPDRVGFAYRTLPGHPVDGEEAFVVHRDRSDGVVVLAIRSLTRPAPQQPWRALHPLLRVVQRIVRRRYLRSLR